MQFTSPFIAMFVVNSECFFAGCISISDGFIQDFTFNTNGSFFLYIYIHTLKTNMFTSRIFFLESTSDQPLVAVPPFFLDPRYHLRRRTRERCPPPGKSRRGGWEPPASGPSVPQTARLKPWLEIWATRNGLTNILYIYISIYIYLYIYIYIYKYSIHIYFCIYV